MMRGGRAERQILKGGLNVDLRGLPTVRSEVKVKLPAESRTDSL